MCDKEFKELVKIAVEKLKDESVLKLLQADASYQKDSNNEGSAEDAFNQLDLTEKQREVCQHLIDCRDKQDFEYGTHAYIAGLMDAFHIMAVLFPEKISNGKWYWWSRGFGGYSALNYLMKVKEYGFVEAVETLTGQAMVDWKPAPPAVKKDEPKILLLPPKNKDCDRVTEYLFGRGIDYQILQECIAEGIIFESADYHNAVFIGKDESGTPKYAACRGTMGSFKRDASGSDKRYSFWLLAKEPTDAVHLFEAAIDLLSYATYLKCEGKDYKAENLLSLSGISY